MEFRFLDGVMMPMVVIWTNSRFIDIFAREAQVSLRLALDPRRLEDFMQERALTHLHLPNQLRLF